MFCLWLMKATEMICERYKSESEVAQSCLTLWDPMGCSLPGCSIHGIFQAWVLEWVIFFFFRRSSHPKDWTQVFSIVGKRFYHLSHRLWLIPSMVLLHSRHLNKHIWSTDVFFLKTQMQSQFLRVHKKWYFQIIFPMMLCFDFSNSYFLLLSSH